MIGLETSAACKIASMHKGLSFSLASNSAANLPFNFAKSVKWFYISVAKIIVIILSLNLLKSSLEKLVVKLYLLSYSLSMKKAYDTWWFSKGLLSLYLIANLSLVLIK